MKKVEIIGDVKLSSYAYTYDGMDLDSCEGIPLEDDLSLLDNVKKAAESSFHKYDDELTKILKEETDASDVSFHIDKQGKSHMIFFFDDDVNVDNENLLDTVTGQYSDGFGEELEQYCFFRDKDTKEAWIEDDTEEGGGYYDFEEVTTEYFINLWTKNSHYVVR